jgi:glycosyltransferase involved in cell wall biosynthesis
MSKENSSPRISILIPSYNTGEFLRETLITILSQSYENWETIIMDGGSTDGTLDILKEYKDDSRIRVFSEPDESPYHAIHKALAKARGEFVYVLAISDGYLDSDWFTKCMKVMEEDSEVSLVWGIPMEANENGGLIGPSYIYAHFLKESNGEKHSKLLILSKLFGKVKSNFGSLSYLIALALKIDRGNLNALRHMLKKHEDVPQKQAWFYYWLETGQIFPDGNMCVTTKAFRECLPPYRMGTRESGDWMGFYFNFNSKGYLAYCIPTPASFGRFHPQQISETMQSYNDKNRVDYFKNLKEFRKKYKTNPKKFVFNNRTGNPISK